MTDEKKKTYLLEDTEIILTGRKAQRTLRNSKIDERFEVRPADTINGSWKKWVRMTDLYEIEEEE